MMSEDMMHQMPAMMGKMMSHPMLPGAMLAAGGYAAGKGLLAGAMRNPLALLALGAAGGLVAGYLACKYQKEIVEAASKLMGWGKDVAAEQKENLADLMAEAGGAPTQSDSAA
ncbi:MAG: hypothetical protein N2441_07555 [Rhodocyclaceae bacterium]|nr:hypothetical protein [Rhodocyclaceae bacterium]